jgi:hypothetical protein
MDAATLSKNLNGTMDGYYGTAYAYGRQFATNQQQQYNQQKHQQQHQHQQQQYPVRPMRHSSYGSAAGYDLYMDQVATSKQQQQAYFYNGTTPMYYSQQQHHQHPAIGDLSAHSTPVPGPSRRSSAQVCYYPSSPSSASMKPIKQEPATASSSDQPFDWETVL